MKRTILLGVAVALAYSWMSSMFDNPVRPASRVGPDIATAYNPADFIETPTSGLVREVTAYNVGVKGQTSDDPCIGAAGQNLCRLVAQGLRVCAANFVPLGSILKIEEFGMCIVLDRMHRRFAQRVDIAMRTDEVDRALEFGIQQRYVEVKPDPP
jgi:3D (Asp-Asp-Asp) domain-containing protein